MKKRIILFPILFFCLSFGIQLTSYGKETLAWREASLAINPITILIPPTGEKAYGIAGEAFADLWEKVTGQRPVVSRMESGNLKLPDGDVVLIGSDAVNPVVHELISSGTLESLNIVYGNDNYRMLSINKEGRSCLILAGGSGRSTMLNPHSEQTLKGNAENGYCRSHQYELLQYFYRPELTTYWNCVLKRIKSGDRTEWKRPAEFGEQEKIIVDRFYETSLAKMAPTLTRDSKNLSDVLIQMEKLTNKLLDEFNKK